MHVDIHNKLFTYIDKSILSNLYLPMQTNNTLDMSDTSVIKL